jgi:signal transduction histidine kinase
VRDLPALIERTREAGLEATLTVTGTQGESPAAVDLSAYRIVQEALTNVMRHAAAHRAIVTLTYFSDALEVVVLDDGTGTGTDGGADGADPTGGHGLVGMRERVALFGGSFEAGDRGHGPGYRVRALIPLN